MCNDRRSTADWLGKSEATGVLSVWLLLRGTDWMAKKKLRHGLWSFGECAGAEGWRKRALGGTASAKNGEWWIKRRGLTFLSFYYAAPRRYSLVDDDDDDLGERISQSAVDRGEAVTKRVPLLFSTMGWMGILLLSSYCTSASKVTLDTRREWCYTAQSQVVGGLRIDSEHLRLCLMGQMKIKLIDLRQSGLVLERTHQVVVHQKLSYH